MSDEYEHKLEAKSDFVSDASTTGVPDIDAVPDAELPDQDLYHSHSWWTTYVFSQDAKYIGIQYALTAVGTGLLGLVLSWIMRIQLAFPGLGWPDLAAYYQFVNYARDDNGNLFTNCFIFGGVWKFINSSYVRIKRYGLSLC